MQTNPIRNKRTIASLSSRKSIKSHHGYLRRLVQIAGCIFLALVLIGCKNESDQSTSAQSGGGTLPQKQNIFYVSTSGKDSNDGKTTSTAWRTLYHAEANATAPGAIIALKRGDVWGLNDALGIHHGGAAGTPIIWDGGLWGDGAPAVIRSTSDRDAPHKAVVNIIGCRHLTFQNITVDGNDTNAFGLVVGGTDSYYSPNGYQDSETGITIQDCAILNCGDGLDIDEYVIAVLVQTWNNDMSNIIFRRNIIDRANNHTFTAYCGRSEHGATPAELTGLYVGHNTVSNFGMSGSDASSGISMTQTVTAGIVEHNTLVQGVDGQTTALVLAGISDGVPTGAIVRYNKVSMRNQAGMVIQNGYAPSATVYGNLFYVEDARNRAAIWLQISQAVDYTGADLRFYHNTIVVGRGVGYMDDTSTPGVCTFTNNIVVNMGPGQFENPCYVANTANSTSHSNNAYYRTEPGEMVHAIESDVGYVFKSDLVTWEIGTVVGNPLLEDVNGLDWHLQAASPVIGQGAPFLGIGTDYDGQVFRNPPSMGAYEAPL